MTLAVKAIIGLLILTPVYICSIACHRVMYVVVASQHVRKAQFDKINVM